MGRAFVLAACLGLGVTGSAMADAPAASEAKVVNITIDGSSGATINITIGPAKNSPSVAAPSAAAPTPEQKKMAIKTAAASLEEAVKLIGEGADSEVDARDKVEKGLKDLQGAINSLRELLRH